MQRDVDINFDLENSPLQIKTDSAVGSNEKVDVTFHSKYYSAGGVLLFFSSPPQYQLFSCNSSPTNFPTDLPSETEKVWTITWSKVLIGRRRLVVIHCNDKEVINVEFSSEACTSDIWIQAWDSDIEKINFNDDTASDFYRTGKINIFSIVILKE